MILVMLAKVCEVKVITGSMQTVDELQNETETRTRYKHAVKPALNRAGAHEETTILSVE